MVVVSGSWVKNVATYPAPTTENDEVISASNSNMCAKAVLISRPNSHPFQERTLALDQPVKIGRSVARARATSTNAIFDCKVLSRHHAVLWYENGKFFLQDTKSSNGTFVNNTRLSSSESEPHEVSSGDIVQFGVDVVENNRKVTHGCIVATLKLYLPDGKEAKASPSITESSRQGHIPLDELYRLNQIIQEASQREQCLETKLCTLQQIVEEARKSAEESWQAYIGEEKLLSRVATLENQLQQAVKNFGDDKLKEELTRLQEEKTQYQLTAKETLCKLHAERLQAVALATEQERARISTEQEAILIKEQLAQVQQELQAVAQKLTEEKRKMEEDRAQNEQKRQELEHKLESEMQAVTELKAKLEQYNKAFEKSSENEAHDEFEKGDLVCKENGNNKEDILAEFENCDNKNTSEISYFDTNITNDHIDLVVAPVVQENDADVISFMIDEKDEITQEFSENTSTVTLLEEEVNNKNKFAFHEINDSETSSSSVNHIRDLHCTNGFESQKNDNKDLENDNVDSKTLKYQLISVQKQMSKRVEDLEEQVMSHSSRADKLALELKKLHEEYKFLQESWEIKRIENGKLLETISNLQEELMVTYNKLKKLDVAAEEKSVSKEKSLSESLISPEVITALEEELVLLKERYADLIDEKMVLCKKITALQTQYRAVCNASYNKMFFYVAPLVFMVLYLLFTAIFS
ncbi:sarcolemmal membrane-associated protein isoform X1 [Agrilus planipennis]|uniref:Sarcolemmal membrane-associated protein n=1 Tax=Agrilus planipennis TaxID=224129 RepID=A0A1W4X1J9_AGRPL|nr:sarcolemmal membrane-associated protein isoform X1 [Agrilus planipennis]